MTTHLPVLCPQSYVGCSMVVNECNKCPTGWDKSLNRCRVETGAEHLPDEVSVPDCPIQDRCQHQLQSVGPCLVRRKGLICESALTYSGLSEADAMSHPLSFSAMNIASEEELRELGLI